MAVIEDKVLLMGGRQFGKSHASAAYHKEMEASRERYAKALWESLRITARRDMNKAVIAGARNIESLSERINRRAIAAAARDALTTRKD